MRFKELLYKIFQRSRDVQFYADVLPISENYLNRRVNYATNKPSKQHINEVVIYNSMVLLKDFLKDILQVAFDLNLSDVCYFRKLFGQKTKLTSSQYRNSIRQDLFLSRIGKKPYSGIDWTYTTFVCDYFWSKKFLKNI